LLSPPSAFVALSLPCRWSEDNRLKSLLIDKIRPTAPRVSGQLEQTDGDNDKVSWSKEFVALPRERRASDGHVSASEVGRDGLRRLRRENAAHEEKTPNTSGERW